VYFERTEEGDDEDADTRALPDLKPREALNLIDLFPEQHFTEPPARFTEATLVKALEENGIGRPSTYATILSNLMDRTYVEKLGRALKPTQLGRDVSELLISYFPGVVDLRFTAHMEEELDEIAAVETAAVLVPARLPAIVAEGLSLIVVEQDIAQALKAAAQVYCLQEGRIALQGKAAELTRESISAAYFGV